VSESASVDTEIGRRPEQETERTEELSVLPGARASRPPAIDVRRLRDRLVGRPGPTAAGVLLAAALLFCYLCWIVSTTASANSDAAGISLQGWDLSHGNPMLRNWITGDVNFYTFETPLYAVVERVMGLRATTMHVVAALIYTLVMLVTAWLAKGDERGMRAWARFGLVAAFMAFPLFKGDLTPTLLGQPDHIGTAVFMLLAYLLVDRASGRRGATWVLFALLVAGQLGDTTVKYVGVIPVVLVCVSRPLLARRLVAADLWMAFAAAASIPGEAILRAAMRTWGAYSMVPPETRLAKSSVWLHQLHLTFNGLLTLFNVPTSSPSRPLWPIAALLGAFVLLAGIYGFVRTLVRWPRAAAADQLLVIGIPLYLAAYAFSNMPVHGGAYEFLGVIPMIVALAVRNLPLPAPHRLPLLAATAGLAGVAVLATGFGPGAVSDQERLAAWLNAHGLKYGIAQYWDAAAVTADSGNTVGVRPVTGWPQSRYIAYAWYIDTTWYDPAIHDARFFIADEALPGFHISDAEAAYGKPQAIYHVANRDILVYQVNLLRKVVQTQPPNY
jgi:hypothetical protein